MCVFLLNCCQLMLIVDFLIPRAHPLRPPCRTRPRTRSRNTADYRTHTPSAARSSCLATHLSASSVPRTLPAHLLLLPPACLRRSLAPGSSTAMMPMWLQTMLYPAPELSLPSPAIGNRSTPRTAFRVPAHVPALSLLPAIVRARSRSTE